MDRVVRLHRHPRDRRTGGHLGDHAARLGRAPCPPAPSRSRRPRHRSSCSGRFLVDDEADIANVTAISQQSSLRPLSTLTGGPAVPPPPPLGEPVGTPQDIPTDATFFDELGDALSVNPPTTAAQRELFDRAEALGVGPGRHPIRRCHRGRRWQERQQRRRRPD